MTACKREGTMAFERAPRQRPITILLWAVVIPVLLLQLDAAVSSPWWLILAAASVLGALVQIIDERVQRRRASRGRSSSTCR
jgi:hypothetical protein